MLYELTICMHTYNSLTIDFSHFSELGVYISNNEKYYNYMNNVTGNFTGLTETYGYDNHIKLVDTGEELKGGILTVR